MERKSDLELALLVRESDDRQAFAEIVARYTGVVYSVAMDLTGDRPTAEEVTQDVFMRIYRGLSGWRGESRFSTWVYRIAYNAGMTAAKRLRKHPCTTTIEGMHEVSDPLPEPDREGDLQAVRNAIGDLPPDERALIGLFYAEERTTGEIAHITGLSESNVRVRLHRIRQRLKRSIKLTEDE